MPEQTPRPPRSPGPPGPRRSRGRRGAGRDPGSSQTPRGSRNPRGPQSPREREEQRAARAAARAIREAARREAAAGLDISFPDELPVSARRDDIAAAIRDHQVVVVAGETGSGKTTQIPKICLELGYGVAGQIGHTQPRRIAARSVAERIADELGVELGQQVGYQVRFTDHSTRDTLVKVMTDGVLLNELQRDRDLRRYEVIVIDEAHERSLNIDFILGYLKQLLPRRPDLKVIVTSATIDPEKFANHFAQHGKPAPIVEVSGRTHPVEIRYRPLVRQQRSAKPGGALEDVEIDQVTGIAEAVEELWTETGSADRARDGGGEDILVFLSGEREIRDAADTLEGLNLPGTQILPLYARLSSAEQHRVFSRHSGRRVVLATNVAETSLTVPGIRYVVDAGTARISRYSQRTKVQRLPIEPISRASAAQRSGRCGRVADGIAIRLYSEDDFWERPEFTDPEILRTNLASVILQMTSLGLGDLSRFPFVDPPDSRMVADGVRLLHELNAIDPDERDPRRRLTSVGRRLARLPVDPRLARMLLEADRLGVLPDVAVVVAALSIQDVRERPVEKQAQADQQHARFRDEHSDFVTLLTLWRYVRDRQRELSGSAFRRLCRDEYLHYLRIREWQDLVTQLRHATKDLDLHWEKPARGAPIDAESVHRALLAGLLSQVGLRDPERRDYLGARGARFAIQPGSTLFRRPPDWVMSAELVETTRLWARVNAVTHPEQVEEAAAHLVKRQYSEPRWSRSRAGVVADERVTLYGIPLVAGRRVAYGAIDPQTSRDLFIRHALVEGDWDTPHRFFHDNRKLIHSLAELESRARRRDILVDDETLVDFYDERIPADVVSGAHFDSWWKTARRQNPDLLTFTEELLVNEAAAEGVDHDAFPSVWEQGDLRLRLTYQFEPGADADGVTCHIPVEQLNQVRDEGFDWLVPGMREELAVALVRSLPKATRKNFVPAPDRARAALADADPTNGRLVDELARGLYIATGHRVPPGDWNLDAVPDHLRMTFRVDGPSTPEGGRSGRGRPRGDGRQRRGGRTVLGEGKDLPALQDSLAGSVRSTMARVASDAGIERAGLTGWELGELPATFERRRGERVVQGFPALVDEGTSVAVRVLATPAEQEAATRAGVRRLLLLNVTVPWKRILGLMTNAQKLALGNNPHGSVPALLDDVLAAAVDEIVAERGAGAVRTRADFDAVLAAVRQRIVPTVLDLVELVHPALDRALAVRLRLDRLTGPAAAPLRDDVGAQLDELIHPGFVADTSAAQLRRLPTYLAAMLERLDKAPEDLRRDAQRRETVAGVREEYDRLLHRLPPGERRAPDVVQLRWMIEELRISLFAQRLGTAHPVSPKRIFAAMDRVEDAHGVA
ncbi:ATP-dependent RNA helicase HrpA [Piscicoccus intestinalis]|uniref:ATP-dependent RNA helicase HrpA n=1 Tax=Piscicoccus intestinalis TaxID=746033 RepID=UPI000A03222A|nr:ATP-dependent RNA helicase HrpA [Piscicoccus intestinalis]